MDGYGSVVGAKLALCVLFDLSKGVVIEVAGVVMNMASISPSKSPSSSKQKRSISAISLALTKRKSVIISLLAVSGTFC